MAGLPCSSNPSSFGGSMEPEIIGIVEWAILVVLSSVFFILSLWIASIWVRSFSDRYWDALILHEKEIHLLKEQHHEEILLLQEKAEEGEEKRSFNLREDLERALARIKVLEMIDSLPKGMRWAALFLREEEKKLAQQPQPLD